MTRSCAPRPRRSITFSLRSAARRWWERAGACPRGPSLMASSSDRDDVASPVSAVTTTIALRATSFVLLAAIWEIAAQTAGSRTLPAVEVVATAAAAAAESGDLFHHLGVTLARVAAAFSMAMAAGTALGLPMGRCRSFDLLFDGGLVLLLNLP